MTKWEPALIVGGVALLAYMAWRASQAAAQLPADVANDTEAAAGALGQSLSDAATQAQSAFGTPTANYVGAAAGDTFNPIDDTVNFVSAMFSNGVSFAQSIVTGSWANAQAAAAAANGAVP